MRMRTSTWSCLLVLTPCWNLFVADVRAASSAAAPPQSVAVLPSAPIVKENAGSSGATGETSKTAAFTRRPSVDTGLRYSSGDWLINFLSTPTSFVLRRIRFQILFNVVIAIAVVFFYPKYPSLSIPMVGHTLLSSSLGLLLSYRTNSAYARFWEARGHWTKTKSTCRNLAINIKAHIESHSPKASARFLEQLAAYPLTLMHLSLGGAARLSESVQAFIPLQPSDNPDEYYDFPALPAMYLCQELHRTLHQAVTESKTAKTDLVEAAHLAECSHLVDSLLDSMSCCEKILRTPVPWTYSRHTSRFLTLWMGTLPFALVGTLNHPGLVVAVVAAASYCMFGIEEIGHLIEQPFLGDPLEGDDQVWGMLDEDGEASALLKRGRKTQPYDIGIPVCSLAVQIRNEVRLIASAPASAGGH